MVDLQMAVYLPPCRRPALGGRFEKTSGAGARARRYDKLVRDAVDYGLSETNEQMTIVSAAANAGPGAGTVKAPVTAKNVITVGNSNSWRKTAPPFTIDCRGSEQADDARDVTDDSSAGPTADGRTKPDLVAPGTRIVGAASRAACDPLNPPVPEPQECALGCQIAAPGICSSSCFEPLCGFVRDPEDNEPPTRTYLVASGTSFSAPAVAGAAALVRKHFLNNGWPIPSPAMTKAYLLATTTYLTGDRANDSLPSNNQGYGRINLGTAFDGTSNRRVDQDQMFTATGNTFLLAGTVADPNKPFRVVLAWTDKYGSTSGGAWVNDLDLEVAANTGLFYGGNAMEANESICVDPNGVAPPGTLCLSAFNRDTINNVEAVFLPAGTLASFSITVRAMNTP